MNHKSCYVIHTNHVSNLWLQWLARKEQKYAPRVRVCRCDAESICESYFQKHRDKVGLRTPSPCRIKYEWVKVHGMLTLCFFFSLFYLKIRNPNFVRRSVIFARTRWLKFSLSATSTLEPRRWYLTPVWGWFWGRSRSD